MSDRRQWIYISFIRDHSALPCLDDDPIKWIQIRVNDLLGINIEQRKMD